MVLSVLASGSYAEERPDHRVPEGTPGAGPVTAGVSPQNTRTRQEVLVDGIKEMGLPPPALKTLEQVFRQNPDVDAKRFNELLSEASQNKNQKNFTPDQVEGLRALFSQTLAAGGPEAGKELSEAARTVLKQTAATKTPAKNVSRGSLSPDLQALQAELLASLDAKAASNKSNALTPEALKNLLASLAPQQGKAAPAQESEVGDSSLGVLEALRDVLGKEKEEKEGRGEREPDLGRLAERGAFPPPPPRERGREREREKPEVHRPEPPQRQRGEVPQQQSSDSEDKKEAKKPEEKSSKEAWAPKKRPKDDEETKPETKEPAAPDLSNLLNAGNLPKPEPKKSPLPAIPGGGFAGGGDPGGIGAGAGAGPGQAGMGGMMGGGLGGGMGGGGSGMAGPDPFGSVGADSAGGFPPGPMPGGGAYGIVKDGGYGGAAGGGAGGGGYESIDAGGYDDDFVSGPARLPTYSAQNTETRSAADNKPAGNMLLTRYVGFAGRELCASDDAKKLIGVCQNRESKRQRGEWWRKMETLHGKPIQGS